MKSLKRKWLQYFFHEIYKFQIYAVVGMPEFEPLNVNTKTSVYKINGLINILRGSQHFVNIVTL